MWLHINAGMKTSWLSHPGGDYEKIAPKYLGCFQVSLASKRRKKIRFWVQILKISLNQTFFGFDFPHSTLFTCWTWNVSSIQKFENGFRFCMIFNSLDLWRWGEKEIRTLCSRWRYKYPPPNSRLQKSSSFFIFGLQGPKYSSNRSIWTSSGKFNMSTGLGGGRGGSNNWQA